MREREPRDAADTAISVNYKDKVRPADLVNISPGGACISASRTLPAGALVTVQFRHLSIHARVAWSSEALTGVRFLAPLATADVEMLQGASGA